MAYIKKIVLPTGSSYDIWDAEALHDSSAFDEAGAAAAALEQANTYTDGKIAGLGAVLNFKGTKESAAQIFALTDAKKGDVWLVASSDADNGKEYVYINDTPGQTGSANWEMFGTSTDLSNLVTKAQHNAHVHSVTVAGTASASSALSATASIAKDTVVTGLTTGGIGVSVGNVAVGVDGTVAAVTGFKGTHTTAAAITELDETTVNSASASDVNIDKYSFSSKTASKATAATAISVPNTTAGTAVEVAKAGTKKTIPNVTSAGSASTWGFAVANDVLTISGGNSVAPTLGTAIEVIPAVANGSVVPAVAGDAISIPQYTFADVTSSLATKDATGYVASKVTTSEVTVASATPKNTANAITALSAFNTDNAAKGVKVTTQPTASIVADADGYSVVTSGTKAAVANIPVSGTAAAQSFSVTVDTGAPKTQL